MYFCRNLYEHLDSLGRNEYLCALYFMGFYLCDNIDYVPS